MFTKSLKATARKFSHQVWNIKDLSAIDELLHPDVVIHSLLGDFRGADHMRTVAETWLQAFPDLIVKHSSIIHQNDLVAIQWSAKGTHKGVFKGYEPTGKEITYSGMTLYRIRDDKIVEYWAYLDMQHICQQISPEKHEKA